MSWKNALISTLKDAFKLVFELAGVVAIAYLSVFVVTKMMDKVGKYMLENENDSMFDFNNEVLWVTFLVLFVWCVDLIVRPIITDIMRSLLQPCGKKEVIEDGRHSKANVKEC